MNNCVEHDWSWDDDDYGCPVCYGIKLEQERIILLARELMHSDNDKPCCDFDEGLFQLLDIIKGETE